jgi:hypothetical protein
MLIFRVGKRLRLFRELLDPIYEVEGLLFCGGGALIVGFGERCLPERPVGRGPGLIGPIKIVGVDSNGPGIVGDRPFGVLGIRLYEAAIQVDARAALTGRVKFQCRVIIRKRLFCPSFTYASPRPP